MSDDHVVAHIEVPPETLVWWHERDHGQIVAARADDGSSIAYCLTCAKTWKLQLSALLTEGR